MVIELKRNELKQILQNYIKTIRINKEHIQCISADNYKDEEIVDILNTADKNNKYVMTEMKEIKKREEENLLKQIEALKASLCEV